MGHINISGNRGCPVVDVQKTLGNWYHSSERTGFLMEATVTVAVENYLPIRSLARLKMQIMITVLNRQYQSRIRIR
jgi:hypothetical protein